MIRRRRFCGSYKRWNRKFSGKWLNCKRCWDRMNAPHQNGGAMNQFQYRQHYHRNLPHIQPPKATLFVTFRLDGSIPKSALEQWLIEKKGLEMTLLRWAAISPPGTIPNPEEVAKEKLKFHRRWFKKFEDLLDGTVTGPLWLKEEQVAVIEI